MIGENSHNLCFSASCSLILRCKARFAVFFAIVIVSFACGGIGDTSQSVQNQNSRVKTSPTPSPTPKIPTLQREILNEKDSTTTSLLGKSDFRNFTYPLPRGWQDRDSKEIVLEKGVRRMTKEKIGMSYLTTKFFDVTGDDQDEAFVILRVDTGGSAIPQIVYIFEQKNDKPSLLWYFRTGDRADGGLKRIFTENNELVVELFGKDRYIFTQMETSKIVGDEQQLCCPTHYTQTRYKRQGSGFLMQGDRLTYSMADKDSEPVRNMNEKRLEEERGTKK